MNCAVIKELHTLQNHCEALLTPATVVIITAAMDRVVTAAHCNAVQLVITPVKKYIKFTLGREHPKQEIQQGAYAAGHMQQGLGKCHDHPPRSVPGSSSSSSRRGGATP